MPKPDRVTQLLKTHGVSLTGEAFASLCFEALQRVAPSRPRMDASRDMPRAEREVFERAGVDLTPKDRGAADPVVRSAAKYAAILAAGLSTAEMAKVLGVQESRIRQRLTSKPPTLYGIKTELGWRLPRFQLSDAGVLVPQFEQVLAAMDPEQDLLGFYNWFTLPDVDLPESEESDRNLSPREWLSLGRSVEPILELVGDDF